MPFYLSGVMGLPPWERESFYGGHAFDRFDDPFLDAETGILDASEWGTFDAVSRNFVDIDRSTF